MERVNVIALSFLVIIASLINNTSTACVDSCSGKSDGNYQHCSDCQKYVACSNGYKYNMPCPASLVWDDRTKQCDYNSSTCSSSTSTNITCVNSCSGKSDGNYQHCSDCQKYVACSNGYKYNMPCPANLVWDDRTKQCDYNSSTCSSSTSANTTTSVRRTTPIVQTPTVCVNSCSGKSDGNYQHCSDCQKYVACSNGYKYNMPCPANLVWDDRTKQCNYNSSTCSSFTSTNITCVDSCSGKSDGNYQHCSDCQKYVACSNGYKYNMPCPANLVWDDRTKQCDYNSSTCSSSASANTTSSGKGTTAIVQTPTVCVNSCRGLSDGDYQNCQGCRSFVSCSNGAKYTMPCSSNLVWDDRKKRCEWVSSTCP